VAFIDTNRDEFGVEPICATLQVAPSTYYAAKKRVPSARAIRDAVKMPILLTLWVTNRKLYGAHKLWKAAQRAGHVIGRDQVARLMKALEIEGVRRGRRVRWTRGTRLEGLVTHSDAGSQFTSIRYGERLAELGATPSIGSVGDSFDNALAETVNGLYKTELIRGPDQGPWRTIDDVELATLGWVHWYNTERLHGYLDDVPPDEYEEAHYAQTATTGTIGNQ